MQILEGMFLCGGMFINVNKEGKNPSYRISTTNGAFLNWVSDQFPVLGRPVAQKLTAEESRESLERRFGKVGDGSDINASSVYEWSTVSNPHILSLYGSWTDDETGDRRIPDGYQPAPLTLATVNALHGHLTSHGSDQDALSATFHTSATPISTTDWEYVLRRFSPSVHHQYDRDLIVVRDTEGFFEYLAENPVTGAEMVPGGDGAWPTVEQDVTRVSSDADLCPECERRFTSLGMHWAASDCSPPSLTDTQREFITGLLIGGNGVGDRGEGYPHVAVRTKRREFAEWLTDWLGILANDVTSIDRPTRASPFEVGREIAGTTQYGVKTRRLSDLSEFEDWYVNGEKRIPTSDITRSPALIRGFYAAVGSLQKKSTSEKYPLLPIGRSTASDGFYQRLFEPFKPAVVHNGDHRYVIIRDRAAFFEYVGDPIPGFENEWLDPAEISENHPIRTCPTCGNAFHNIGNHWSNSECSHPSFTKSERALVEALLFCGITPVIDENGKNPGFEISSASKPFLEWLTDSFGRFSSGVSPSNKASGVYLWRARSHPDIQALWDTWKVDGDETMHAPEEFRLTPTGATILFATRGRETSIDGRSCVAVRRAPKSPPIEEMAGVLRRSNAHWTVSTTPSHVIITPHSRFFEYAESPPGMESLHSQMD